MLFYDINSQKSSAESTFGTACFPNSFDGHGLKIKNPNFNSTQYITELCLLIYNMKPEKRCTDSMLKNYQKIMKKKIKPKILTNNFVSKLLFLKSSGQFQSSDNFRKQFFVNIVPIIESLYITPRRVKVALQYF